MIKKFMLGALALFMFVALSACSGVSTAPDEQALHYSDGPISSKKFSDCVDPGNRDWNGPGDQHYTYPAKQRTFSFTGREGAESKAITVKTKDSQEMSIQGFITFSLTSDCKKLKEFHERIGNKYKAYEPEGWRAFLGDYVAVPLNNTMDKAALQFDWRTLYSDNKALVEFENFVKDNLPAEVKTALGEDFIEINAVSLETPVPSEKLREGLEAKEKAKLDNDAQKEKNETARTKYDSFTDCKKVLSESSCLTIHLAENGDIPIYPIPQGSAVNIPGAGK